MTDRGPSFHPLPAPFVFLDDLEIIERSGVTLELYPRKEPDASRVMPCGVAWSNVTSRGVSITRMSVGGGANLFRLQGALPVSGCGWSLGTLEVLLGRGAPSFMRRELLCLEVQVRDAVALDSARFSLIGLDETRSSAGHHRTPAAVLADHEGRSGRWSLSAPGGVEPTQLHMGAPGDLIPLRNVGRHGSEVPGVGMLVHHQAFAVPWAVYQLLGFAWQLSSPLRINLAGVWEDNDKVFGPGVLPSDLEVSGVGWQMLRAAVPVEPRLSRVPTISTQRTRMKVPSMLLGRELDFGEAVYAIGRQVQDDLFPVSPAACDISSFVARHGFGPT